MIEKKIQIKQKAKSSWVQNNPSETSQKMNQIRFEY